jgi:hypothetical protein
VKEKGYGAGISAYRQTNGVTDEEAPMGRKEREGRVERRGGMQFYLKKVKKRRKMA